MSTGRECSICYDELGTTNTCVTPCGHEFCFKCMMSALNHNNTCPCCRTQLKEVQESDEEDDDDDEEEFSEYDWNPEYENINIRTVYPENITSDDLHNISNHSDFETPEIISKKIQNSGYTMEDVVSIWLGRIQRSKSRYNRNSFVNKMVNDIQNIVYTEDHKKTEREFEIALMSEEDVRMNNLENKNIFDEFPDLNLNVLFNNM